MFLNLSGEEGNLVGKQNLSFKNDGVSPNGYSFCTNHPENFTGIWDVDKGSRKAGAVGISCTVAGGCGYWTLPEIKFKPGKIYTLSFMAMNTKLTGKSNLALDIYSFDKEKKSKRIFAIGFKDNPGDNQWYQIKGSFICPDNAAMLRVRLYLTVPGEAYYDDVQIIEEEENLKVATKLTDKGWSLDNKISWTPLDQKIEAAELPQEIIKFDGGKTYGENHALKDVVESSSGTCFNLEGEAGMLRSMLWQGQINSLQIPKNTYVTLVYSARNVTSFAPVRNIFSLGAKENSKNKEISVLNTELAMSDNIEHTMVKRIDESLQINSIQAGLVTESDQASLSINDLSFSLSVPKVFNKQIKSIDKIDKKIFKTISLQNMVNDSLEKVFEQNLKQNSIVVDGVYEFPSSLIDISGAPFEVITNGNNIISPKDSRASQLEKNKFLGEDVIYRNFRPSSRDDAIIVELKQNASEVLFLLTLVAPANQKRYGLPPRPLRLDDIENVSVEIVYASGEKEIAFPYSLADKAAYIPYRMIGAYVVSTDKNKEIEKFILHNNAYDLNFSVAGITLNKGKALVPELSIYPKPQKTPTPQNIENEKLSIFKTEDILHISNSYYEYKFNLKDGFSIESIINKFESKTGIFKLSPSSGLAIRQNNTIYTGRCFNVKDLKINNSDVTILLDSKNAKLPIAIKLKIAADKTPELRFNFEIENKGQKNLELEASFIVINNLKIGSLSNTRMFFPQCRVVDTDEKISLKAPFGMSFPFQFMDIYNKELGIGLMVMTKNMTEEMLNFCMSKTDEGVSSMVSFPGEFNRIDVGKKRTYPELDLIVHNGDWHEAMNIYKESLNAWYKPYKSQDKDFFLSAFDVKGYILGDKLSRTINRVPAVLSKDKKNYRWGEIFELEEEYLGHIPDIVHFFHWFRDEENESNAYGTMSSEVVYSRVGGLEKFKETIAFLQDNLKHPVSLFTISDRFDCAYVPKEKKFNTETALCLENGSEVANSKIVYTCNYIEKWRDFAIAEIVKLQKDTGSKIIYLDVFASFSSKKCYSNKHGHPAPSNPLKIDKLFIKQVRDSLPKDVAIWNEYPLMDTSSQYADGSINYYFLELSQRFARPYNNNVCDGLLSEIPFSLTRYITPRYKQFTLPVGIEGSCKPSQVDASFFNGEAFHEVTWRLHPTRIREKINRSYQLKHKYADCFSSLDVTPRVFTLASGIEANCFKGSNRTLWTLYNTRPTTYLGPVLEIEHEKGNVYYDAWNDVEITPEIKDGKATITLIIHPQQPGCIVQERKK